MVVATFISFTFRCHKTSNSCTDGIRRDFNWYIWKFGLNNNEQTMRESFFWNLEKIVKPYCDEMKDASVEFHLDENEERRKT